MKQKCDAAEAKCNTTAKQLKIARESNVELEGKIEKTAKGTRLVICLQNYVRKMLQEKLEESARQLDSLAKKNKTIDEEITLLRRQANKLEEDQIEVDGDMIAKTEVEEAEQPAESATEETKELTDLEVVAQTTDDKENSDKEGEEEAKTEEKKEADQEETQLDDAISPEKRNSDTEPKEMPTASKTMDANIEEEEKEEESQQAAEDKKEAAKEEEESKE